MTETAGATIQLASGPVIVLRALGAGGSSVVWAVERAGERYALKIGKPSSSRFIASEAKRLTLACSPVLPRVLDVGRLPHTGASQADWSEAPYLLMNWVPGQRLSLAQRQFCRRDELEGLAQAVARDIGRALADLHEAGVAHGDVKPDNILVDSQVRDDTTEHRCTLIDLGLSGEAAAQRFEGATPRYLPPELRDPRTQTTSDGQSRDLWALGLTLVELFDESYDSTPTTTIALNLVPTSLRPLVAALTAPTAAARPRARWVAQQAGYRRLALDHHRAVQRAYLAAQKAFLDCVSHGARFNIALQGYPGKWLTDACAILSGIPALNTQRSAGPRASCQAESLPAERQRRLLVGLCGLSSIDFPPIPAATDEELLAALLKATEQHPPEALSFSELTQLLEQTALAVAPKALAGQQHTQAAEFMGQSDLALSLGAERPSEQLLAQAESSVFARQATLPFTLALGRALKRRGELGRARAVLLTRDEPEAAVENAAVLARSGDPQAALVAIERLLGRDDSPIAVEANTRATAAALQARLHLAQGNVAAAETALRGQHATVETLEAQASVALSHVDLERAQKLIRQARTLAQDSEQRARLEALDAHLCHQSGDHKQALTGYQRAAEHAARVGALLEEATYLVGIASAASHLALSDEALRAAQRAEMLFEFLHNPAAAARATLSRASTLTLLGAETEAATAAQTTIRRAREARDARCEAYARLLASEVCPITEALEQIDRAERLLEPLSDSDRLRLATSRLRHQALASEAWPGFDALATDSADLEVQLEWWTARARDLLAEAAELRPDAHSILNALGALVLHSGPVDVTGRAFAAGAELAARTGDGDRCLRFLTLARAAHQQIVEGAPSGLKLTARQLPWAAWLSRHTADTPLRSEQIIEIEKLVRSLGDRGHLRSVLERALDALIRWTGVERGLLLLKAPEGRLVPRAARNLARKDLTGEQLELSQTLARRALETGDCVVAVDASGELSSVHHSVHALQLRSVLAVPLAARGETLGVVYLDDRVRRGAFGDAELSWVRLVASIASVAIADARDQTLLRRAARRASRAELRIAEHLALKETELSRVKAVLEIAAPERRHPTLVGSSLSMRALLGLIDRVATSDVPVLISGESGTGKELVARAIHSSGSRTDKPFISENCSAIPEPLLESTLFGHQKGAFTGATQSHIGLFELAHQGTLLLDELGEMSLAMQAKLLRVLETGELRRVGGERTIGINVRVLGASHKDLAQLVERRLFREDLYYRLNVVTVHVPPLRERCDDIPELVAHFLAKHDAGGRCQVTPEALTALQTFSWPGNVRQLENEIRRAIVLSDGRIRAEHLSPAVIGRTSSMPPSRSLNLRQHLDALEVRLIEQALLDSNGNQTRTAEVLGISRFGLQKMLKRLGIALPQ